MRLIVAHCAVEYAGRLSTKLAPAVRLIMINAKGGIAIHDDGRSNFKPLNWMTPPTVIERSEDTLVVRKHRGEEVLRIELLEVLEEIEHPLDAELALEKAGEERELQELLAAAPGSCGEGFRLVRREWPTDIGPVDLMCRDPADDWVAVEIKRVGTIEAVEQLARYIERIRVEPGMGGCRGVLAAQTIKPQARALASARGLSCVEVDLDVLRGAREPELQLFVA
jgi:RecB family endonuclease NucS